MKQAGAVIKAAVGRPLVIELDSNPTTGYQWQASFPAAKLRLVKQEFHPGGTGVGAAGKERFVFEPLGKGDAIIELTYKRSWEAKAIEQRTFRVSAR